MSTMLRHPGVATAPQRDRQGDARAETASGVRRTLLALLACGLAATPMKALLSDNQWLVEACLAMVIVIAPAALLRMRRPPSALDVWPGVVLLAFCLTRMYVPHHAFGGWIPTGATVDDIRTLMNQLHRTSSNEVAPIQSTVAVRMVVSALFGLLAALIDLIAVVGRRGALAGVPLLVVYTVAGAVRRSPVVWVWFCLAAVGFLILLSLDAADELRHWGRRVSRAGDGTRRQALAFSAPRIGLLAVVVAVLLPLLVPAHADNLIASAFHGGGSGGQGVQGIGAGHGGTSIDPFVALRGQIERDKPVPLINVHVESGPGVQPFYLRTNVLDRFTGASWVASEHGGTDPVTATGFETAPAPGQVRTVGYQATITITGLSGNPPVFSVPSRIEGLDPRAGWSPQDQLLLGTDVRNGMQFSEFVAQPQPTTGELAAARPVGGPAVARWLQLPALPEPVTRLVHRLTSGRPTPWDKASAIFRFFSDPANGFVYSLRTPTGDSGNDLVDFLRHRAGFCQQYAAAMAVMLRSAGVPARIVLGYMHTPPDAGGDFSISTFDAHAWVEAYFGGIGWIPFDPTPAAGLVGGRRADLPWARHNFGGGGDRSVPTVTNSPSAHHSSAARPSRPTVRGQAPSGTTSHADLYITLLIIVGVALIVLVPAFLRRLRRRRRFAAARRGDPDPLWAELSDTAVDLGYVWSPTRSPRQVSAWLARDAGDAAAKLDALAVAVEEHRYAAQPQRRDTSGLAAGLLDVTDRLRSRRSRRAQLHATLLPASLGWRGRLRRRH